MTGWFTEFERLEQRTSGVVPYPAGAAAFGGATYDPTSHYRAAAVFAFHEEQRLTPAALRTISRRQVGLLKSAFESLDADPRHAAIVPMAEDRRGGFLALRAPDATAIAAALRSRGVSTDARGEILRLGPAPYLRDDQLQDAVGVLGDVLSASA